MPQASPLVCRLFINDPAPVAGQRPVAMVELENTGAEALEIPLSLSNHPFRNLAFMIERPDGSRLASKQPYGINFINGSRSKLWKLGPGQRYTHSVYLGSGLDKSALPSGYYRVQAVYDTGSVRAVSEIVMVNRDQLCP